MSKSVLSGSYVTPHSVKVFPQATNVIGQGAKVIPQDIQVTPQGGYVSRIMTF